MTDNELKEWFFNKYNNCFKITSENFPDNEVMFYDINFIRKAKFNILQENDIKQPTKPSGICLFKIDFRFKRFYCDYNHIWKYLELNTYHSYSGLKELVKYWLIDIELNNFEPYNCMEIFY